MKLRNKLIPILSVGSVALATPIALTTSCGFSIDAFIDVPSHNMLKEYENHVRAADAMTIVGNVGQIGDQYALEIWNNSDILKDDLMFTISNSLTKAKTDIESKLCKFTKYQLNIKDFTFDPEDKEYINFTIEAKIAGEPVNTVIGTKKIKSFDVYFQLRIDAWWELEFIEKCSEGVYKDQYLFNLKPDVSESMLTATGFGSYTYEEAGQTKTVEDYTINQVINWAHKSDYAAGALYDAICQPTLIASGSTENDIVVASHYLKNANIVKV